MITLSGKSVFGGVAIGKIAFYKRQEKQVRRYHVEDTEAEVARFEDAQETAIAQLGELYDKAMEDVGEANAAIFEVHQMMLMDLDYVDSIKNIITTQEVNAEYAVATTGDNFSQMFASMDDAYMQGRAADVKDVSDRLLGILSDAGESGVVADEPVIVAADDLVPSETVQLDKSKVLAFATMYGSANSHTAILARTMNIPAVIGLGEGLAKEYDGHMAAIDGFTGTIYIDPDEETMKAMTEKREEDRRQKTLLEELKGKENVTLSGQKINVYANIGNLSDVGAVLKNDAGGIGLFRSEFLYLESEDFPTEEQQFQVYKQVAENMAGKKVIIRTLDIGGDKEIPYMGLTKDENPFLGYRAIRFCLDRKEDVYKPQLRALLRASAYGNIKIMVPMVTCIEELREAKALIEEIKKELDEKNIPYKKNIEVGIMVETAAASLMADVFAKEAAFFSIGTNDLTQYTMSVDRGNDKVSYLYSTFNPAVVRSIKRIITCGREAGIMVGMCGEAASDPLMIPLLLAFGLNEFSMSASAILYSRKLITSYSIGELQAVADKAMSFATAAEVEAYMREFAERA